MIARSRLLSIQFARGAAALLVATYHGARMMDLPRYAGHEGLGGFFAFGYAGVDFFFVLSGFIIFFVHRADVGQPKSLPRYGWRRVTRVYPAYWLMLAVVTAEALVKHDPSLTVSHFLYSLFLLPDGSDPVLDVAWTLVFEILFYLVFAAAIVRRWLGVAVAIVWLALVVGVAPVPPGALFQTLASPLNLMFAMGMATAWLVMAGRVPFARMLAAAGLTAFLAAGLAENAGWFAWASPPAHLLFGACSAMAIAGMAAAELQGKLKVGKVGEFFGGASYLLYLVHTLVIGAVLRGLEAAGLVRRIPDAAILLLAVAASTCVAALFYRWFDRPVHEALTRFGRERLFGRSRPVLR